MAKSGKDSNFNNWVLSTFTSANDGAKVIKDGLNKKREERKKKAQKRIDANNKNAMSPNLLDSVNPIESSYGYAKDSHFGHAIGERILAYSVVSSPSATNSLANWSIWASIPASVLSIALTYLIAVYLVQQSSIGQQWFILPLVSMAIKAFIFATAIFVELYSGKAMKEVFNNTAQGFSRVMMFTLGFALSGGILYSHLLYNDTFTSNSQTANIAKSINMQSAETVRIASLMKQNDSAIQTEMQSLTIKNDRYNAKLKAIDARAKTPLAKAKMYRELYENAVKKGRKLINVAGKKKLPSTVNKWANAQQAKADKILEEKQFLIPPTSPRIKQLQDSNNQLTQDLQVERDRLLKIANANTAQSSHGGLMVQLIISLLAKLSMLGYFILRLNIKNEIIPQMHSMLMSLKPIEGAVELEEIYIQRTAKLMDRMRQVAEVSNLQIANSSKAHALTANRQLQSNQKLITAVLNSNQEKVDELIDSDIKNHQDTIDDYNTKRQSHANYTLIGDKDIDITGDRDDSKPLDIALQAFLNKLAKRINSAIVVQLVEHFNGGRIDNNAVIIGNGYSREDSVKILIHELSHWLSGSDKHNEEFVGAKDRILEILSQAPTKQQTVKQAPQSGQSKQKDTQMKQRKKQAISDDRAMEILCNFLTDVETEVTSIERDYLISRGAWKNGKVWFEPLDGGVHANETLFNQ